MMQTRQATAGVTSHRDNPLQILFLMEASICNNDDKLVQRGCASDAATADSGLL